MRSMTDNPNPPEPNLRSFVEQSKGLQEVARLAGERHRVNLVFETEGAGTRAPLVTLTCAGYADDHQVMYVFGDYDLWLLQEHDDPVLYKGDVSAAEAAAWLADAYIEAKAHAILRRNRMSDEVIEKVMEHREEFFALIDDSSDAAKHRFIQRFTS